MYKKKCIVCGSGFECVSKARSTCSKKCRTKKRLENSKCEMCGKVFSPDSYYKKWCCARCREAYKKANSIEKNCNRCGRKYMATYSKQEYCRRSCLGPQRSVLRTRLKKCNYCGNVYASKSEKYYITQRFCSRKCKDLHAKPFRKCLTCSKVFRPNNSSNKGVYCCFNCYKLAVQKNKSKCFGCGSVFVPKAGSVRRLKYCSDTCYAESLGISLSGKCFSCGVDIPVTLSLCAKCYKLSRLDSSRRSRHIRRSLAKTGENEAFSSHEIFARDKWKCQHCGIATLKKYDPSTPARLAKSPTLDHVIPLSKGGSHTSSNTQLLCSKCNSAKGAKVLLLF